MDVAASLRHYFDMSQMFKGFKTFESYGLRAPPWLGNAAQPERANEVPPGQTPASNHR